MCHEGIIANRSIFSILGKDAIVEKCMFAFYQASCSHSSVANEGGDAGSRGKKNLVLEEAPLAVKRLFQT